MARNIKYKVKLKGIKVVDKNADSCENHVMSKKPSPGYQENREELKLHKRGG